MLKSSILSLTIILGSALALSAQDAAPRGMSANVPADAARTADTAEAQQATAIIEQSKGIFVANQDNDEKRIPDAILAEARAVLIMQITRGAIGIGASEGKGIATNNNIDNWSPPAFYQITSGSLGIQLAARQTNIVAVFMTEKATKQLYTREFQWGVGLNVQAGPVGGDVSLTTWRDADILVYDTSKGLDLGVQISGGSLGFAQALNDAAYGKEGITAQEILGSTVEMPAGAKALTDLLREYSFVATQSSDSEM